jgi:hypothetical protein
MKKLYFENEDATECYSLDYFMEIAKSDGVKEISVLKAIKDTKEKFFIWCGLYDDVVGKNDCGKSNCDAYVKGRGNTCVNKGKLYTHGDSVTFKVE